MYVSYVFYLITSITTLLSYQPLNADCSDPVWRSSPCILMWCVCQVRLGATGQSIRCRNSGIRKPILRFFVDESVDVNVKHHEDKDGSDGKEESSTKHSNGETSSSEEQPVVVEVADAREEIVKIRSEDHQEKDIEGEEFGYERCSGSMVSLGGQSQKELFAEIDDDFHDISASGDLNLMEGYEPESSFFIPEKFKDHHHTVDDILSFSSISHEREKHWDESLIDWNTSVDEFPPLDRLLD
jgi:hypothetical protein